VAGRDAAEKRAEASDKAAREAGDALADADVRAAAAAAAGSNALEAENAALRTKLDEAGTTPSCAL
jgi:hypothetical protein